MRTLLALLLSLMLVGGVSAQSAADRAKKSDEILHKIKQLDLMNQLLPLLMTKDQLKKILPAIEKARQKVDQAMTKEFDMLRQFEGKVAKAHSDAFDKGAVPGRDLLNEIIKMFKALNIYRALIADENTDAVIKVLKETLNAGQIKAATNALDPQTFDPSLKPEQMTEDQKLRFFVKEILLDPAAYDVLVEMNRRMKS